MIYEIVVQGQLNEHNEPTYVPIFRGYNDEQSKADPSPDETNALEKFIKERGINPALTKDNFIDCDDISDDYEDCFMCLGTGDMNHKTGCATGPHQDEPYQPCDHCLGAGVDAGTNTSKPFFDHTEEWMTEMDKGLESND